MGLRPVIRLHEMEQETLARIASAASCREDVQNDQQNNESRPNPHDGGEILRLGISPTPIEGIEHADQSQNAL